MTKRQWLKRNKVPVLISILFLVIGFIAGLGTHPYLPFVVKFDEKIDAIELFGIFCTIALLWVVTSSIEKHKSAEHHIKVLLGKRLEEIYELSYRLNEQVGGDELSLVTVTASLKRMSLTVKSVDDAQTALKLGVDAKYKADIDQKLDELNGLMTSTPVDRRTGPNCPLRIEKGMLKFNESRRLQITQAFDTLRETTTAFQLAIYDS